MTAKKKPTISEQLIVAHWIEEGRKSARDDQRMIENRKKISLIPKRYQTAFRRGVNAARKEIPE